MQIDKRKARKISTLTFQAGLASGAVLACAPVALFGGSWVGAVALMLLAMVFAGIGDFISRRELGSD